MLEIKQKISELKYVFDEMLLFHNNIAALIAS